LNDGADNCYYGSLRIFKSSGPPGFTLVEVTVVVIILAVLMSWAAPLYQKTIEQSNVDMTAANLETIWTAERLYFSQSNPQAFADLPTLYSSGLLDPSFYSAITTSQKMRYVVPPPEGPSFTATATRINSGRWTGYLSINEQGVLWGQITGASGAPVLTPPSY
jgi:prepilin-type N-terminal cleavage/methylation domain-containing protein